MVDCNHVRVSKGGNFNFNLIQNLLISYAHKCHLIISFASPPNMCQPRCAKCVNRQMSEQLAINFTLFTLAAEQCLPSYVLASISFGPDAVALCLFYFPFFLFFFLIKKQSENFCAENSLEIYINKASRRVRKSCNIRKKSVMQATMDTEEWNWLTYI